MAHFARLNENNVVTMVTVVSNDDMIGDDGNEIEALGVAVCESVVGDGRWVQTSYNGNFRKQYAGIGYTYHSEGDVFVRPSPHPSWHLDEDYEWTAPIPQPDDGASYEWDEESQQWIAQPSNLPDEFKTDIKHLP